MRPSQSSLLISVTAVTDSKDKELMKVEKRRGVVRKSDLTQSLYFSVKTLHECFTVKSDIFKRFSTLCGVQWLNGSSLHILDSLLSHVVAQTRD